MKVVSDAESHVTNIDRAAPLIQFFNLLCRLLLVFNNNYSLRWLLGTFQNQTDHCDQYGHEQNIRCVNCKFVSCEDSLKNGIHVLEEWLQLSEISSVINDEFTLNERQFQISSEEYLRHELATELTFEASLLWS